jgi:flagellar basal-body rod protein FlgC
VKFTDLLHVASSALSAQSTRLRVSAENLANASTVNAPGEEAFKRKIVILEAVAGRNQGPMMVRVSEVSEGDEEGTLKYEPAHPKANEQGYVLYPSVSPIIEMADLRDAEKSYRANLQVIEGAKRLVRSALQIIR